MPPVPQSKKNDEGKVTEGQSISLPQPARNENEESMSIDSSSNSDNDAAIKQPHILRSHKTPENEKPIVESKLTIQSDKGSDLVVGFESPKKDNDAAIKQPHILRSHKTPENEKPIVENKLAIQSDKGSDVEVLYESPRKQSNTQPLKETLSKKVGKQKQSSPEKQSPPWEVVLTKKCQVSLKGFTFKVWLDKQRSFELNDRDLASLSPTRWLRGNIIDFYLQYIIMKSNYQEKTHLFSTDFYSLLSRKEKNDEALVQSVTRSKAAAAAAKPSDRRPWTKNIDIFSQDFIIIPANIENVHWILIIITFLKNVCLEELKSNDASEKPCHILRSRASSENEKSASVSRASRSDRANDASEKPSHILRSRTSSENEKSASESRASRSDRANDASEKPSHILRSRTSSENEKSASERRSRATRSDRGNVTSEESSHILRSRSSSESEKSTSVSVTTRSGRANDASEKPPHVLHSCTSSENEKSASERRSRATQSDRGNDTSEESSHILRSRSSSENEKSTSVSVTTRSDRGNRSSSETKSKTKVPKIFVYDSLKSDNKQVVTRIRNFLQEEWEFKKKGIKSFDEKVLPLGPENSAEQLDNHSCGLYVFYFLEKFFKKKMFESNEELTIDEHFRPALKRKEVFEAILKLKKTIAPV
nr:sentrin-specific protease 6 isoform X2 [Parasteatoda tepidariorum]